jgi:hypothetical protein
MSLRRAFYSVSSRVEKDQEFKQFHSKQCFLEIYIVYWLSANALFKYMQAFFDIKIAAGVSKCVIEENLRLEMSRYES